MSCASSVEAVKPDLPPVPAGLVGCTGQPVPGLPGAQGTGWGVDQVAGIIGDQRGSALAKDRCAHDWDSFYQDLRTRLMGGHS